MRRLPAMGERSGRFLIGLLLCLKLLLLAWNAVQYDGRTYDAARQSDRALFAGLRPGELSYDPPLYYLPARLLARPADVPRVERSNVSSDDEGAGSKRDRPSKLEREFRDQLLDLLRYTNVFWIGFFYLAWIGYAFPRLLGRGQSWFLASALLLAVPGYQKLAAMSHPDNAFAAGLALAVCVWLSLRERWLVAAASSADEQGATAVVPYLLPFALSIGFLGLTRPLAAAPVLVLTLVALVYVARASVGQPRRAWAHAAMVVVVVGVLSASWYVVRWQRTGAVLASVPEDVAAEYRPLRDGFSYARYFTSFHGGELWDDPNISFGALPPGADPNTSHANSFFSLLHSEVWGDHWLSFSGPKLRDGKAWAKRISLATAFAVPLVVLALAAAWLWSFARRLGENWRDAAEAVGIRRLARTCAKLEPELVLFGISAFGAALFVWWQAGPALMPGHHSSMKFIHLAALLPPAIALLFSRRLKALPALLLTGYFLVLFMAAFPVAMYWPR